MKTSRAGQLALFFCPFSLFLFRGCEYRKEIAVRLEDIALREGTGHNAAQETGKKPSNCKNTKIPFAAS